MKKFILSVLTAATIMSGTVYAAGVDAVYDGTAVTFEKAGNKIAIVSCYDNDGKLCYSNIYKSEDGSFKADIPDEFVQMKKRVYFVDTKEFDDINVAATQAPEAISTPSPTTAPTETPQSTPAPTEKPADKDYPSVYEKEVDALNAPAVVKEVDLRSNDDGDYYGVTILYHGEEMTVGVETELEIATAPSAYEYMKGQTAQSLEEGDVITLTANIAGDTVNKINFLYRPQEEDIVTSDTDFGTNFEKLVTENGNSVAEQWKLMKYGEKPSSDRYQYVFGLIGKKNGNNVTLINKTGSEDTGIEVTVSSDSLVYTCDMSAKEDRLEIGSVADIITTIPSNSFNDTGSVDVVNGDYSYNYMFARVIDGIATDIVLYNNYNE